MDFSKFRATKRNRTADPQFTKLLLYQLSYGGDFINKKEVSVWFDRSQKQTAKVNKESFKQNSGNLEKYEKSWITLIE